MRCSGSRGMFGIVRAARPSMPLSLSPEPEVKEPFASEGLTQELKRPLNG